jgi:hypothetical protein
VSAEERISVIEPRSRVEHLARVLNTLAKVLFVAFVVAAVAGVMWVDDEFTGRPPLWRYILAITAASGFLVAGVIAKVGSALVEALGRVRGSLLDALAADTVEDTEVDEQADPIDLDAEWSERGIVRN